MKSSDTPGCPRNPHGNWGGLTHYARDQNRCHIHASPYIPEPWESSGRRFVRRRTVARSIASTTNTLLSRAER